MHLSGANTMFSSISELFDEANIVLNHFLRPLLMCLVCSPLSSRSSKSVRYVIKELKLALFLDSSRQGLLEFRLEALVFRRQVVERRGYACTLFRSIRFTVDGGGSDEKIGSSRQLAASEVGVLPSIARHFSKGVLPINSTPTEPD